MPDQFASGDQVRGVDFSWYEKPIFWDRGPLNASDAIHNKRWEAVRIGPDSMLCYLRIGKESHSRWNERERSFDLLVSVYRERCSD